MLCDITNVLLMSTLFLTEVNYEAIIDVKINVSKGPVEAKPQHFPRAPFTPWICKRLRRNSVFHVKPVIVRSAQSNPWVYNMTHVFFDLLQF